jgi:hypothetical protein
MSFIDLGYEEVAVGEEFSLVDGWLIKKHTGDDSGDLVAIDGLDSWIDAVTDEVLSVFALDVIEPWEVNLRKLEVSLSLLVLLLLHLYVLLLRHVTHLSSLVTSLTWLAWCSLGTHCFVIAILLLIRLMTWILMWILLTISSAHILVVATSALSSTATSAAPSTSVVIFVFLEITSHILLGSSLIPLLHWLHSLRLIMRLVLTPIPHNKLLVLSLIELYLFTCQINKKQKQKHN